MTKQEEKEILEILRSARNKARGYADFFGWPLNRDYEELGIVKDLAESLELKNNNYYINIKSRGRPNDPPDCEAIDKSKNRIAIEVTELVDEEAIKSYKAGVRYNWASWSKEKFINSVSALHRTQRFKVP